MSHPVWVRGLKLDLQYVYLTVLHVAPRVGAWIETLVRIVCFIWSSVAPRVGAWIETISHICISGQGIVAPRVGAWIETR